jgi:hypothetical protein
MKVLVPKGDIFESPHITYCVFFLGYVLNVYMYVWLIVFMITIVAWHCVTIGKMMFKIMNISMAIFICILVTCNFEKHTQFSIYGG